MQSRVMKLAHRWMKEYIKFNKKESVATFEATWKKYLRAAWSMVKAEIAAEKKQEAIAAKDAQLNRVRHLEAEKVAAFYADDKGLKKSRLMD